MAGNKHPRSDEEAAPSNISPFIPMFEVFRGDLDEHQDRRERIIKASRDITAFSKKMIFSLQRVRQLNGPLPSNVTKENDPRQKQITDLFTSITPDLQGLNAWRYQRDISGGIQEYMEAISFQHYLETQQLITYAQAQAKLPDGINLTEDDYVLGLFDLVGELMRFAITTMATSGEIPRSASVENGKDRNILTDLRALRACFGCLDTTATGGVKREVEKKMKVMRTCVEKVEGAVYGMIIRGRERPKGWVPDAGNEERREPVETY
ncbi:hypothetical protein ACLMJK_006224 [Lecanora helva]